MNKWWITGEPLVMHLYFRQVLTFQNILDCVMSLDAHSVFQTRSLMGSPTGEPLSRCVPASPSNINHRCSPTHYVMWILMQVQYFSNTFVYPRVKKSCFTCFTIFHSSCPVERGANLQYWIFLTVVINMFHFSSTVCFQSYNLKFFQ